MSRVGDRIRFGVTGAPGTAAFTAAAAVAGYLLPAGSVPPINDQDLVSYVAIDGSNWETGRGVWTASSGVLTRSVVESSNANALVSFGAGVVVTLTFLATDLPQVWYDFTQPADGAWPTISNIPGGWAHFEVELMARTVDTSGSNRHLFVKLNGDSGANYDYSGGFFGNNSTGNATTTVTNGASGMDVGWVSNANGPAGQFSLLRFRCDFYTSTAFHKKLETFSKLKDTTTVLYSWMGHCEWHPGTPVAVTSVSFAPDIAANLKAGSRIRLTLIP